MGLLSGSISISVLSAVLGPCLTILSAETPSERPIGVDSTIVLKIGANAVSEYAVEKNFRRSFLGVRTETASADAKRRWFESFLAKQVLIAQALAEGFDQRPEVTQIVNTMERTMLSQSTAAFSAKSSTDFMSEEYLRTIYHQMSIVPEVIGVRLPPARMKMWKGDGWDAASNEEKLARLTALARAPVVFYQGPLPWPREPFPEVEGDLRAASVGKWIQHETSSAAVLVYVASVQSRKLPPFDSESAKFESMVRQEMQQAQRRVDRTALLDSAGVEVSDDIAIKLADALALLPAQTPEIPKEATRGLSADTLVSYRRANELVTINVEAWRTYYNLQFVRRLPRTPPALLESIQEMISTDLGVLEARKRGADQAPRFIEDRRNFIHYQALDLLEKEQLIPKIVVSDADLRLYYAIHTSDFAQPVGAHCLLLRFETEEKATSWLKERRKSGDTALNSSAILDKSEVRVSHETPLSGLANATDALLHLPDHAWFGPAPTSTGWIVILKRSTDAGPLPYATVSPQVRARVIQDRLDEEELRLARQLARKFEVNETLPYSKFGVSESLARPWK